jgi:hypothetical protein
MESALLGRLLQKCVHRIDGLGGLAHRCRQCRGELKGEIPQQLCHQKDTQQQKREMRLFGKGGLTRGKRNTHGCISSGTTIVLARHVLDSFQQDRPALPPQRREKGRGRHRYVTVNEKEHRIGHHLRLKGWKKRQRKEPTRTLGAVDLASIDRYTRTYDELSREKMRFFETDLERKEEAAQACHHAILVEQDYGPLEKMAGREGNRGKRVKT